MSNKKKDSENKKEATKYLIQMLDKTEDNKMTRVYFAISKSELPNLLEQNKINSL